MTNLVSEIRSVLITGGAGFIGVNAARYFFHKGWEVILFDNFSRKGTDINVRHLLEECPSVEVVRGDIRFDLESLAACVERVDVVIHLAAQVAVTTSIGDPRADFETNVVGTFNVLEAIRNSERKPFLINASTNKVFGALEECGVCEVGDRYVFEHPELREYGVPGHHPLDFHSPYGCSKGAADQYVRDYARVYGLKTVTLRQSCIYGTNQFGVEDQGWLAWFAIATMLDRPITIYGTGRQVRDVLFVDDLVHLYESLTLRQDSVSGKAYAVGGGPRNTVSLIEFLDHLSAVLGKSPDRTYAEVRAADQPVFVADIRPLTRDIGWEPKHALSEGLPKMIGWMRAHEDDIRGLFGPNT